MKRLIAWVWRLFARVVQRHYKAQLITVENWYAMNRELSCVVAFCGHSGFLRDGRYPGGRHAERKICGMIGEASCYGLAGICGEWQEPGGVVTVGRSDRKLRAVELEAARPHSL